MKKEVKKYKNIIIFCISIIILSLAKLNLTIDGNFFEKMRGNSLEFIFETIFLMIGIDKLIYIYEKRLSIFSSIVALILSICQIAGYAIVNNVSLFSKILLLKFIGYWALFYIVIMLVYYFLNNITKKKFEENWKLTDIKLFFIIWAAIFLSYIPYFLKYFPGIASTDSIYQMYQATGNMNLINSHPIFHTMIISGAMNLGKIIGSYNIGVGIYSIIQMLFMSAIFSYTVCYMKKKEIPKIAVICSIIFFAIFPVMPMYSITMWKDIPFGVSILLYVISMVELATNADQFLNTKRGILFLIVSALFTMFFKHNGFYIVLLSIPFVLFFIREHIKKLLIIFVGLVIFYKLINGPLLTALNVAPTLPSEALSIPIQQLSRVVATEDIDDIELKEINEWIIADKTTIKEEYNPRLSDPMKKYFNNERFKDEKIEFLKLWFKYLKKYPNRYVQSFLFNTYGYWYPDTQYWMFQRNLEDEKLNLRRESKLSIKLLDGIIEDRNIPVISTLTSLGFAFWIIGIMMFYAIYKKEYKKIIIFIPVIILWLTSIASSVFCEYRYMFGAFTAMPIIVLSFFIKENYEIKEGTEKK